MGVGARAVNVCKCFIGNTLNSPRLHKYRKSHTSEPQEMESIYTLFIIIKLIQKFVVVGGYYLYFYSQFQ